jgi:hypothetical protein
VTDRPTHGWETLPDYLARTRPDGPPPGLVPVRLCPVQVFGADECDQCQAPAGYGLMDAVSAWSDCNRAYGRIYRRDDDEFGRAEGDTILAWVEPAEAAKFEQNLGHVEAGPVPHVARYGLPGYAVRVELTVFPDADPDAKYIEQPVPIPNDDPDCGCTLDVHGLTVLGVRADARCPHHGRLATAGGGEPQEPGPVPVGDGGLGERRTAEARARMTPEQRTADDMAIEMLLHGEVFLEVRNDGGPPVVLTGDAATRMTVGGILGGMLDPKPLAEQSGPPWTHSFPAKPPCDLDDCCDADRPCGCNCHKVQPTHTITPWPERRTPEQWCAEYDLEIADPDGWRGPDAPPWGQPVGLVEFSDRYALCTTDMAAGDQERFDRDTRAARSEVVE